MITVWINTVDMDMNILLRIPTRTRVLYSVKNVVESIEINHIAGTTHPSLLRYGGLSILIVYTVMS
jgi:hypothetical protein